MDSTAYRFFLERVLDDPQLRPALAPLPLRFTRSPVARDADAAPALSCFLRDALEARFPTPSLLFADLAEPFRSLFRSQHSLTSEALRDADSPATDRDRRNGADLLRLLTDAALPDRAMLLDARDAPGLALFAFSLEACMHLGWCPSALEGQAKRAAHLYFGLLKKSPAACDPANLPPVVGYVWGAWLLSQSTEGIREARPASKPASPFTSYEWQTEDGVGRRFHLLTDRTDGPRFLASYRQAMGPHPFGLLESADRAGVSFLLDGAAPHVMQESPVDLIQRKHMAGLLFRRTCAREGLAVLDWTTVLTVLGRTVYRIDVFRPLERHRPRVTDMRMHIEAEHHLSPAGQACLRSAGMVVRFLKDPFGLRLAGPESPWLACLEGSRSIEVAAPVQMIAAWACGRGVSDIDRTNLLGIYDI